MKQLVEFTLPNGNPFYAEVETDLAGEVAVAAAEGAIAKAEGRFNDGIDRLKEAANYVLNSFKELNSPQEIALEFGVKLSGKAGAVFASAETEANFKVSLKWTNKHAG